MSKTSVEFLPGPFTSEASRTQAESGLHQHPAIKKGAAYALEQLEGRWVAAVVHEAGPPPFAGGDEEESAPPPKAEGGSGESDSGGEPPKSDSDSGGGDSDSSGESKPPHEKGGEMHQVMQLLQTICDALGIPAGLGDMPPGGDPGMGGPPGPPGLGGPPVGGPPGAGGPPPPHGGGDQVVRHERVTKPGETPPGGTPIGTPAFASVREDHPWGHLIGKVASFEVTDKIGNMPIAQVNNDLTSLASEIGYRVSRLREAQDEDGDRAAVAVITAH